MLTHAKATATGDTPRVRVSGLLRGAGSWDECCCGARLPQPFRPM